MRILLALILAAALAAPGVARSAGESVTLAYSQLGLLAHLPWQVALGQKYFDEQGLEPKGYNFESGAKSIAALIGGSADFAANALEHAIKARVQGKDLVYVFSSTRLPGFGLAVASTQRGEIKTVADLKGKLVGVSGIGAASHVLLDYILRKNGVGDLLGRLRLDEMARLDERGHHFLHDLRPPGDDVGPRDRAAEDVVAAENRLRVLQ